MPRLAPVSWHLDLALVGERPQRPLDGVAQRAGVHAVGVRALHQHAGPGQPVAELERERALLGIERHHELVAVVLAQRLELRRQLLVGGHHEHGEVGRALGHRAVELAQRAGLRELAVLGLHHHAPARGAVAGVERHDDVADLAGGLGHVAHRLGHVALAPARVRRRRRTRPPRSCAPWRCRARARPRARRASPSRRAAPGAPSPPRRASGAARAGWRPSAWPPPRSSARRRT